MKTCNWRCDSNNIKMLRKVINPFLFLPIALSINSQNILSSETQDYSDKILKEKMGKPFVSYVEIEKIVLNNQELKSLENLVEAARFDLSSQIGRILCFLLIY